MLQDTPNIILGLMVSNGCIWCETNFATSVPRNSRSGPKTQVLHLLNSEGFRIAPKHSQASFSVPWSRIDAFGAKPFSQLQYPEIVCSGRNTSIASFYIPKHSEMLQNTPKHHLGSNRVELMHLVRNHIRNFGSPK